jgi:hypothetical protein
VGLSPTGMAPILAAPEPYERHYRIRLPPWMMDEEYCSSHTAQSGEHSLPRAVSGSCQIERCSPWPAPFSPQAPPKIALLCSHGSSIVWRGPTPPERARPPCDFGPSRTGLVSRLGRGAPEVSRFSCMLFLSVRGFFDYAGPTARSRVYRDTVVLPSSNQERVGVLVLRFSKLNSPAHRCPCLRFERHLAMPPARLRAKMESLSPLL